MQGDLLQKWLKMSRKTATNVKKLAPQINGDSCWKKKNIWVPVLLRKFPATDWRYVLGLVRATCLPNVVEIGDIRDFVSSPQWLYQWQLQWHVIISTEFYPIKPKFLWKICRDSLSVNTTQQIARFQKVTVHAHGVKFSVNFHGSL